MAREACGSNPFVSPEEMARQKEYSEKAALMIKNKYAEPKAHIRTYGCQQNVSDSERIRGLLSEMGYGVTETAEEADLILFNTCAVREHAEDRVFGNVGALKHHKRRKPDSLLVLCGCMMQQQNVADRIKKSYPHIDLVFGTHVIHRLPELIYKAHTEKKRIFELPDIDGIIAEGLPVQRDGDIKGWLPIMYGCNNFCTYCIVPYVRGRERSRNPENILEDAKTLIASGIKDITLLGQNVNSYNGGGLNFSQLLRMLNELPGDFRIRFMTSHPKDCTAELLQTMADCGKVAKHLHLPFQAGSDEVLKSMNRRYDKQKYLSLIQTAKQLMPTLTFTSDVIVGFPGESYENFLETLELIKEVQFTSLFTFIFSPREGTPAAKLADPISREEKVKWFSLLTKTQEEISLCINRRWMGKTLRVLVEEEDKEKGVLNGRTEGNIIVEFEGPPDWVGSFPEVRITETLTWVLKGSLQ